MQPVINSREPKDLFPSVREKLEMLLTLAIENDIHLLVTSTYRDFASQDAIYAQGRTTPGKIVTNAKGGDSYHNYRMAFDVVPLINGKAVWEDKKLWYRIGGMGKMCGLEWGGDWKKPDMPHFQDTHGISIQELKRKYPDGVKESI